MTTETEVKISKPGCPSWSFLQGLFSTLNALFKSSLPPYYLWFVQKFQATLQVLGHAKTRAKHATVWMCRFVTLLCSKKTVVRNSLQGSLTPSLGGAAWSDEIPQRTNLLFPPIDNINIVNPLFLDNSKAGKKNSKNLTNTEYNKKLKAEQPIILIPWLEQWRNCQQWSEQQSPIRPWVPRFSSLPLFNQVGIFSVILESGCGRLGVHTYF